MIPAELIMLEAIALVCIGVTGHVIRNKEMDLNTALDCYVLGVIAGIGAFAMFGEPTSETVIMYIAGGYGISEFFDWLFKPWWESD